MKFRFFTLLTTLLFVLPLQAQNIDSLANVRADSLVKIKFDSLMQANSGPERKYKLDSLVKVYSDSVVKVKLDSIEKAKKKKAEKKEDSVWSFSGGLGIDFSQMLLVNPRIGAGENKIGLGGNTGFEAEYNKDRASWGSKLGVDFGVQKLGDGPFQKTLDNVRLNSQFNYSIAKDDPIGYAVNFDFQTQLTPTFEGNQLTPDTAAATQYAISEFLSPATVSLSFGMSYKPDKIFSLMLSPLTFKSIFVLDDSIAQLSNSERTVSLHGNPLGGTNRQEFINEWRVTPAGQTFDSLYYAKYTIQMGASLKATYKNKFFKDKDGKHRLAFSSSLSLFSDYLRNPQFIDIEWTTNTDIFIFKGLSISLGTILFYDYDVLVQVNADGDRSTGVNGYEETARRPSFTQTLLIKYNFLF